MRVGHEVLSWVVVEAVGSGERGVEIGGWKGLPLREEAAEIQPREESCSTPSGVYTEPGALPRTEARWGRGGMLKRMLIEATLEALEVFFVTVLCFYPRVHMHTHTDTHITPHPPQALPAHTPHSHPLNHQVTMEEEDESRGKTEESGEDRGDGPPDRDPTLSPTAFILVRLRATWGQRREELRIQI